MKANRFNFRAWDGDLMHHNVQVIDGQPVRQGCQVFSVDNSKVWNKNCLMQSTGLTDKNGKEIFEGDFVEGDGEVDCVEWEDGQWRINPFCDILFGYESDLKIIGNIFENPELLEAT